MCRFASFMSNVMCLLNANTNDYMEVGMNDRVDCVGFFSFLVMNDANEFFKNKLKEKKLN